MPRKGKAKVPVLRENAERLKRGESLKKSSRPKKRQSKARSGGSRR